MFERVLVESDLENHPRLESILQTLNVKAQDLQWIERVDDVFNRVKKPYLQKRTNLQLFIAKKRGTLVKEAPPAYGQAGDPHYYFIHAYNCIYECSYCYLQGHFNSPDLVLFLNHEDIIADMRVLAARANPGQRVWFHAGEFSDSLALSHITQDLPLYFDAFASMPNAWLEIRTKSVNTKEILKQKPLPNIIVSYSLAPTAHCRDYDLKAPPLSHRLKAMQELEAQGHPLAVHFDPIIIGRDTLQAYADLLAAMRQHINLSQLQYMSLGVVRFTKPVFKEVQRNYPDAGFLSQDLVRAEDGKVRYPRPVRLHLLKAIRQLAIEAGVAPERIYLCMEESENV